MQTLAYERHAVISQFYQQLSTSYPWRMFMPSCYSRVASKIVKPFSKAFAVVLCLLFVVMPSTVRAQVTPEGELTRAMGGALWTLLGNAPYAQSGSQGLVVYMLSFSSCPHCNEFMKTVYRSYRGQMMLREIFVPTPDLAQAVDVGIKRDPAIVDAYYNHMRQAPPITSDEQRAMEQRLFSLMRTEGMLVRQAQPGLENGYPLFVIRVGTGESEHIFIQVGFGYKVRRAFRQWLS